MCEATNLNAIEVAAGAGSGRDITFMSIFLCSVDNYCSSSSGGDIVLFLFAFLLIPYHFYYYFLPFVLCISITIIFSIIILNGNQRSNLGEFYHAKLQNPPPGLRNYYPRTLNDCTGLRFCVITLN